MNNFSAQIAVYAIMLQDLLCQIKEIEDDKISDTNEKFSKIKKIREEITKVGTEIDNAKKGLTLVGSYKIN
jgi:hypothetical protein